MKQIYHEDEGCSIDNVAKVADDVVDVFKDSPRSRTAKVAIALYVWDMMTVGYDNCGMDECCESLVGT